MFTIYSLNKLTDREEDSVNSPERTSYIQRNGKLILVLSIASCSIAILLGFSVKPLTIPIFLFPLLVGIIYSIQIHPKIPRLKDITGIKSVMVATSWAVLTTFLPAIYLQNIIIIIPLIFYFFFTKIFVNTVIFDVRDIEGDQKNNIRTIPVAIGRTKTKKMLLIIHSSLIPWLAVSMYLDLFTRYIPVLIFCIIYGFWYINYFCNNKIPQFATDILIDGEWLFVAVFCFIINIT